MRILEALLGMTLALFAVTVAARPAFACNGNG